MPVTNGSFEEAGAKAYLAAGWTVTVTVTSGEGAFDFAEYVVDNVDQGTRTQEEFDEGWGTWKEHFAGFFQDLTYAVYDLVDGVPRTVEDFNDLWGAGSAELVSSSGPWVLAHTMALTVSVDGGPDETINFFSTDFNNIGDARPEEVVRAINAQAIHFAAQLYGDKVKLIGSGTGPAHSLQVTGGTANAELQFSTVVVTGTPDGSPWLARIEYSLVQYGADLDRFEAFSTGWGTFDYTTDPDDLSVRFTIFAADGFETGWKTYDMAADPEDDNGRYTMSITETFDWD